MIQEYFLTGYCKAMDGSRTVTVEVENATVTADCDYPGCPWATTCPIASQIDEHQ